jgi:hypothetical protein
MAAKNDDAPILEYLWDDAIVKDADPVNLRALTFIQNFSLRWWKKHTTKDFIHWLRTNRLNINDKKRIGRGTWRQGEIAYEDVKTPHGGSGM